MSEVNRYEIDKAVDDQLIRIEAACSQLRSALRQEDINDHATREFLAFQAEYAEYAVRHLRGTFLKETR